MDVKLIEGDLLEQGVEVIVNAWNRNFIPWWLLIPRGVSGAIKKRGGFAPFRELGRKGILPLGGAVETGPGKLPFKAIIHVAGIGAFWTASERSIRLSVVNAIALAAEQKYRSIAFPLIGAGTGGFGEEKTVQIIQDALATVEFDGEVRIVKFRPKHREQMRDASTQDG